MTTTPAPAGSAPTGAALVAGAGGRFGEALLNRVLASGDYDRVVGLAQAPMTLGVRGLSLATLAALPPLDDVFVNLAQPGALPASFHGRDAVWAPVDDGRLLAVARAAYAAGARRLVLVAPAPVWQQIGGLHRVLNEPLADRRAEAFDEGLAHIVIAKDRQHRRRQAPQPVGDPSVGVRGPVLGQVAGRQDQVGRSLGQPVRHGVQPRVVHFAAGPVADMQIRDLCNQHDAPSRPTWCFDVRDIRATLGPHPTPPADAFFLSKLPRPS